MRKLKDHCEGNPYLRNEDETRTTEHILILEKQRKIYELWRKYDKTECNEVNLFWKIRRKQRPKEQ